MGESGRRGGGECKVLTFFDPSQVVGDVEQEASLVHVWQLSWLKAGWVPVVLRGEESIKGHGEYNEMLRRAVEGVGGLATKPIVTRWLAVAAAGGGLFAHYDLINFGVPPPANCLIGPLSTYGDLFPFLLSGQPDDFARLAQARLPLPMQAAHPAPSITGIVSPRFRFPAVRGIVRCSQATLPLFLQSPILQLPQWRQVSALLCSHFSRTTTFRAFAIPPLATVPAALASLRSSLSSCPNYTLPSFPLLLPPSPSNLTFLLLPHHISLALATDYLSYSANSQNAPAWFKNLYPGMPVPAGVTNLEFSTPSHTTCNLFLRIKKISPQITGFPGPIGRGEGNALENAVRAGWEATRPFASQVHGEVLDTIVGRNQVDVQLLQAGGVRVEEALAWAKVLDG
ncbi:unnamed protein product [Closterium sp. Naga37s-1]|nr:unnamed protein product [Closterium sp. Naga37s-1]